MGTRADFYLAKSKTDVMEYKGSIAWDGYEIGDVATSTTKDDYLSKLKTFLDGRDDSTYPEQGFPWPWKNSKLTDECYVFLDETNTLYRMYNHDGNYEDHTTLCDFCPINAEPFDDEGEPKKEVDGNIKMLVPDMTAVNKPTLGSRSGIIIVEGK